MNEEMALAAALASGDVVASVRFLNIHYPGWQVTVQTERFSGWLRRHPKYLKFVSSDDVLDASKVIREYMEATSESSTPV